MIPRLTAWSANNRTRHCDDGCALARYHVNRRLNTSRKQHPDCNRHSKRLEDLKSLAIGVDHSRLLRFLKMKNQRNLLVGARREEEKLQF